MNDFYSFLGVNPNNLVANETCNQYLLLSATYAFDQVCDENFYVIDLTRQSIPYMSENLKRFLTYKNEEVALPLYKQLNDCVPSTDKHNYKVTTEYLVKIYRSLPESERRSLVISGHHRLFNKKEEVLVFERAIPLLEDSEGNLQLVLCSLTGSSEKSSGGVLLSKLCDGKTECYSIDDKEWHPIRLVELSEREHMMLNMAARGYTVEQMSSLMFVGLESLKKYRKNLMKKLDVDNMSQAVRKAYNLRLM